MEKIAKKKLLIFFSPMVRILSKIIIIFLFIYFLASTALSVVYAALSSLIDTKWFKKFSSRNIKKK